MCKAAVNQVALVARELVKLTAELDHLFLCSTWRPTYTCASVGETVRTSAKGVGIVPRLFLRGRGQRTVPICMSVGVAIMTVRSRLRPALPVKHSL